MMIRIFIEGRQTENRSNSHTKEITRNLETQNILSFDLIGKVLKKNTKYLCWILFGELDEVQTSPTDS